MERVPSRRAVHGALSAGSSHPAPLPRWLCLLGERRAAAAPHLHPPEPAPPWEGDEGLERVMRRARAVELRRDREDRRGVPMPAGPARCRTGSGERDGTRAVSAPRRPPGARPGPAQPGPARRSGAAAPPGGSARPGPARLGTARQCERSLGRAGSHRPGHNSSCSVHGACTHLSASWHLLFHFPCEPTSHSFHPIPATLNPPHPAPTCPAAGISFTAPVTFPCTLHPIPSTLHPYLALRILAP